MAEQWIQNAKSFERKDSAAQHRQQTWASGHFAAIGMGCG
jgi:hypothetical protein